MAGRIQLRRGTAANWTSANPTLAAGEVGVETDTGYAKVGDGTTAWTSLEYVDQRAVDHIADTTAAHAASAIGFTPTGNISATDTQAAIAEVDSEKVDKVVAQTAGTMAEPFRIEFSDPSGPNFELRAQDFANSGGGAGTRNHGVWFGFNTARHATGSYVSNQPAIMMGFEDNYYDIGGDEHYGVEWYVEYWSRDGSSQQALRPFYVRIFSDDNTPRGATILQNIGTNGGNGTFSVKGGTNYTGDTDLFAVSWSGISMLKNVTVLDANMTIRTTTGQAKLLLDGGTIASAVQFLNAGATSFNISATSVNTIAIYNKNFTQHVQFNYGATVSAATTDFYSSVKIQGGVGFYNTAPVTTKPTVSGAKGSNAALGSLLTALASLGLITDSSSA